MSPAAQSLPVPHLRAWRESRFLSMGELAEAARVSRHSLIQWERGHRGPSFPAIRRLAAALEIPPDKLVRESPDITFSNTRGAA